MSTNKSLVIGAGIAGIRTALELAESQHDVVLLETSPYIGGTLPQLDKQFPSDDCGMCKILPSMGNDCSEFCFRRGAYHKNVELITDADLVGLSGHAGNFKARVRKNAAYVKADKCIACGECVPVCEVDVAHQSDKTMDRKAIYIKYPLAYPNVYTIDDKHCNQCGKCVDVCPTKAIDLDATHEDQELDVGAVVLSMGFNKTYDEIRKEYGYEHYDNVITNTELERALGLAEPSNSAAVRLAGKNPKIAFLQCVSSREDGRNFCSAACCMIALKEAVMIKEMNPQAEVKIFFMDMRAYGKGYHRYYTRAKELGVEFIRSRVSHIEEQSSKELEIRFTTEDDKSIKEIFDVVVLSVGQTPSKKISELSDVLGIELNEFGFCKTLPFSMVETTKKGILACGSITSPKDIGESVTGGVAAAAGAAQYLSAEPDREDQKVTPAPQNDEPRIGVFVCKCGKEIAHAVAVDEVVDSIQSGPGVSFVQNVDYLCVELDEIKSRISESDANRIVFAACAPYHFEKAFEKVMADCHIDSGFFEIVNLREQVAWVHDDQGDGTKKATTQIRMAVEKLRSQESGPQTEMAIDQRALVIGGGIAGMTAALRMAGNGIQVDLVEKTDTLGGILKDIHYTLDRQGAQTALKETIKELEGHGSIQIFKNAELGRVTGRVGNFRVDIETSGQKQSNTYGAIVVATGAKESEATEYAFGKHANIISQHDLETRLAGGDLTANTVVMIQCVGSREADNKNYCSRICCSQAVKNANKLKELDPRTEVFILNRDIMTYGLNEAYYTEAREKGVFFIRYTNDEKPQVQIEDGDLLVSVGDHLLQQNLVLNPDLLVLSTGMQPNEDNKALADLLQVPLDDDGFFQEANTKFRPVDFLKDGVFVCGTARSPMHINEVITQANAAAGRAITLLSKTETSAKSVVAEVVESRCSACQVCMSACPYEARVLDMDKRIMGVVTAACQGCGACAMACPNGASKLRGFDAKQVLSMIDIAVA
jgi:heterodisulfide reductase subunit A